MPLFVNTFHPADTITAPGKLIRFDRTKANASSFLNFCFEGLYPHPLQRIFGLGIFTIRAIAPITLGRHDRFRYRQRVFQRDVTKFTGFARIGILIAMGNR